MNRYFIAWLTATILLAGCASPAYYYDNGYHGRHPAYYSRDDEVCANCGEIRDIERIYLRGGSMGGGAILGAIIGGVLGSTVGKGDGRTAAQVAGAVAGGFAGDAIERDSNDRERVWRFHIRLDDGRWAVVTQYDNSNLRRGDRVIIRGDHVELLR